MASSRLPTSPTRCSTRVPRFLRRTVPNAPVNGGGRGIRTPDTLSGIAVFQLSRFAGVKPNVVRLGARKRNPERREGTELEWRRERDSNPRYPFGYSGFQVEPFCGREAERSEAGSPQAKS